MPLWAQHLVVDYPAAEQFVHPYRVLLAVIQIVYPQPLEVEVGEFLVRPVVLRAYVTVESTVIEVCQAVFEVGRLLAQPFGESTSQYNGKAYAGFVYAVIAERR